MRGSFLGEGGNPYAEIGADRSGRTGIDFGVYGVPETYMVSGDGMIAYKFIGPMSRAGSRNDAAGRDRQSDAGRILIRPILPDHDVPTVEFMSVLAKSSPLNSNEAWWFFAIA